VAAKLLRAGAVLQIYDPMVSKESIFRDIDFYWVSSEVKDLNSRIFIIDSLNKLDYNIEAIGILTEWEKFTNIDFSKTIVFDGRGINSSSSYSIGKG